MTTKLIKHWIDGWITGNLRRDFHIFQLDSHSHRHRHTQTKKQQFRVCFSFVVFNLFICQTDDWRQRDKAAAASTIPYSNYLNIITMNLYKLQRNKMLTRRYKCDSLCVYMQQYIFYLWNGSQDKWTFLCLHSVSVRCWNFPLPILCLRCCCHRRFVLLSTCCYLKVSLFCIISDYIWSNLWHFETKAKMQQ